MADTLFVDAQGLSCPQPVILTKRALQQAGEGGRIEVLVDSGTSRDNCTRLAEKSGWRVQVEEISENHFRLIVTR